MNDNPYPKGLRLNEEEYNLVEAGLLAMANAAKQRDIMEAHNKAMDLIDRLKQFMIVGEGVPDELAKEHAENIQEAMVSGNVGRVNRALSRWIAMLIRLEPDPAKTIAPQLVQMATQSAGQHQMQHIVPPILAIVSTKLTALKQRYGTDGWPKPQAVIEYLETWLAHGIENVQAGKDSPWEGDEDLDG